jgi:lysine biosynthesis protein LysW
MARVACPSCDAKFELGRRFVGDSFDCPDCETELEIISLDPPEASWAYQYDEPDDDWDDDDDDDE